MSELSGRTAIIRLGEQKEDKTASNYGSSFSSLRHSERTAFRESPPELILGPQWMTIARFNDTAVPEGNGHGGALGRYWFPYDAVHFKGSFWKGYEQARQEADNEGVDPREFFRDRLAVREDWASMRFLIVAQLKVPTYFFYGTTSPQPFDTRVSGRGKAYMLGEGFPQMLFPSIDQYELANVTCSRVSSTLSDIRIKQMLDSLVARHPEIPLQKQATVQWSKLLATHLKALERGAEIAPGVDHAFAHHKALAMMEKRLRERLKPDEENNSVA